ncbi:MAG: OsmC family protein [Bacteroidota bacterium]|nr:OsmC family protein [Bacteroidota bacterium]
MDTAVITYLNELRTEALHQRSGEKILTDAPVDNKGRGAAFSPTDLLATSLATCMITTIAIMADTKGIIISGMNARVVKHMASQPRRVERVEIHLEVKDVHLNEQERTLIENTARSCPVAISLHPDMIQEVHFVYT